MAKYDKLTNPQSAEESIDAFLFALDKITDDDKAKEGIAVLDSLLHSQENIPFLKLYIDEEFQKRAKKQFPYRSVGAFFTPGKFSRMHNNKLMETRTMIRDEDTGKLKESLDARRRYLNPGVSDTLHVRDLHAMVVEMPHLLQRWDPNWKKERKDYKWFPKKEWRKRYSDPKSYEYEAHSVIEPIIENLVTSRLGGNIYKDIERINLKELLLKEQELLNRKDVPYSGESSRRAYIK